MEKQASYSNGSSLICISWRDPNKARKDRHRDAREEVTANGVLRPWARYIYAVAISTIPRSRSNTPLPLNLPHLDYTTPRHRVHRASFGRNARLRDGERRLDVSGIETPAMWQPQCPPRWRKDMLGRKLVVGGPLTAKVCRAGLWIGRPLGLFFMRHRRGRGVFSVHTLGRGPSRVAMQDLSEAKVAYVIGRWASLSEFSLLDRCSDIVKDNACSRTRHCTSTFVAVWVSDVGRGLLRVCVLSRPPTWPSVDVGDAGLIHATTGVMECENRQGPAWKSRFPSSGKSRGTAEHLRR